MCNPTDRPIAPTSGEAANNMPKELDITELKVAILSGTGRMGVHLAAAWANAGIDVIMCSRDIDKARTITDELISGRGYSEGDIMVPRCDASKWRLRPGSLRGAIEADVIVLASPFHVMWRTLRRIYKKLMGKGKIFIDLTNPWQNTSDPHNPQPIPEGFGQSSVLFHKRLLDDPTASWAMAYRHVYWMLIQPTGPSRRSNGLGVEVIGEDRAVQVAKALIEAHGFRPVVREGGIEIAPMYELNFAGNRVFQSSKGWSYPPPGQDSDGLVSPLSAFSLISLDIVSEKVRRSLFQGYFCSGCRSNANQA
mmetsp:Transcript_6154/g.8960  ORF Transcript_6154/g.8960 Transcript_6154/m.8960 type:complete len:308 (+) Transcript_6154:58-981(+)